MARGITQEQVNAAADAILAAGENPTVEKVRAELGTGSPNTITRMLDAWRSQLGNRLRQLSTLPDVPASVGQVMVELWQLATEHAERVIDDRFANDRTLLNNARAELARERESWEIRLQAADMSVAQARAARDLAEHACATLDGQLQDSHALRADLVQQRDRLQDQCDHQSDQILTLRGQLDENHVAIEAERDRQEVHVRTIEDRAHQEIDRARQEAKQWQQRADTAERAQRDSVSAMQQHRDAVNAEVRRLEQDTARQAGQIAALEKALSAARAMAAPKQATGNSVTRKAASKSKNPEKSASKRKISNRE